MTSSLRNRLLSLFEAHGHHRYDERISMTEHMLQAATLASDNECSNELVMAALLHDLGDLLLAEEDATNPTSRHRSTDLRHEDVAEQFLCDHFPPAVVAPIALHVQAKRFLCATESHYFDRLSPGSIHTMSLQGGPMSKSEVDAFQRLDHWQDAVTIRRFDDDAKVVGAGTPSIADFLERLLPDSGKRT